MKRSVEISLNVTQPRGIIFESWTCGESLLTAPPAPPFHPPSLRPPSSSSVHCIPLLITCIPKSRLLHAREREADITSSRLLEWRVEEEEEHGLLERFLGKERNARRKSSTLMYSMDTGDSKNVIFILFLLRPNLVLKVRESRNF